MSNETQTMAFEPFFSTKPMGKGTGLGLATVHGIVSQSGGHIRLKSAEGDGACFSIYFPRHLEGPEDIITNQAELCAGGSESILLVEDSHQVRRLARRMLEREGYEVVEADGGTAALERCEERTGGFDLLLTDVVMPQMNGRELAQRVRKLYPKMAVMYMSGYTDDEVLLGGIRDQGVTFLEKPFSRDRLLGSARSAMDTHRMNA